MIVCIESCIGGGKGFFIKYLSTYAKWAWPDATHAAILMDDSMVNMIEFSSDRARWAMFAMLSIFLRHAGAQASTEDIVFVEGSLFTDFRCAAKRWRAMGFLAPEEFDVLEEWYDVFAKTARCDAVVYLDNDVHTHFERIVNNSKREQAWISVEHLIDMKRDYDATLSRFVDAPTLFLPCVANFEDNEPELMAMAETTIDFLRKIYLRRSAPDSAQS